MINNISLITWASGYFDISPQKIDAWITKTKGEVINTSSAAIGKTLVNVGSGLVVLFLIPVYIFMLLFYQPLLLEFFRRLFGASNRSEVSEIITQIKALIQRYLIGLLIEAAIVVALWGIPGMLMAIPLTAIVKLIFDHIEPFKPWGFLLDNTKHSLLKIRQIPLNV